MGVEGVRSGVWACHCLRDLADFVFVVCECEGADGWEAESGELIHDACDLCKIVL